MSEQPPKTSGDHRLHHLHVKRPEDKSLINSKHKHGVLTKDRRPDDPHLHSNVTAVKSVSEGIPLSQLGVGQSCVLSHIGGEGALRRRLLDMGLTPGTRVLLRSAAPMGDPLELRLRGYSLSLRKDDAALIMVKPD